MSGNEYGYRLEFQREIATVLQKKGYRVSCVNVYEVYVMVGTRGPEEEVQVFVSEEYPEDVSISASHFDGWNCHVDNLVKELEEKLA